MTTIMKSNSSDKRVVDKAENDDCHWPGAKLSVQEDPKGPDVEEYEEPIEQAASYDFEAQALVNSTRQDKITAEIKSTRNQGRGEATVVVKVQDDNSLQAQPLQHTEAEILDFMDRYSSRTKESPQVPPPFESREASYAWVVEQVKSRPKALEYFQQRKSHEEHEAATACILERHKARIKAKAKWQSLESHEATTASSMENEMVKASIARKDFCPSSVMGLAQSRTGGGSSKSLATHRNLMIKSPSPQAAKVVFEYKLPEREPNPRVKNIPDRQVKVPVKVDDWNLFYQATFGPKPQTRFDKLKKNLFWIVVGIIMVVIGLGFVMPNGGTHCRLGAVPFVGVPAAPTNDHQDTMGAAVLTADFDSGNSKQVECGAVSKIANATQATDAPSYVPTSALAVYSPLLPSPFPSKAKDWLPTWPSVAWKHGSDTIDSKAVAIIQVSGTEAPAAIWKLSFEYFELEETGDVHVGIVCDTGFTGADATSKLLYGGPAPLFFKSRTVAPNEVTIDHSVDWYTGLPLITVGFGVNRNRITIVCGDMPIAPSAIKADVTTNDSTSLALFQDPTAIATAFANPSVQAVSILVPIHGVYQLPVGVSNGDSKALVIWRPGTMKQDSVSESKIHQRDNQEVKVPTVSKAFVVTFDVYMLQGKAFLDIHLECVYKNVVPVGLENAANNPQFLFLSHTFSKHQADVSVKRSGNQSLVTIGFWEDEFSITAICEDFDAIGSSSAEVAQATAMMASQQPEPPSSKANSVCCGLKLLLFLALCGIAVAVRQIPKRRIDQAPRRRAAPSDQVPCHPAAPSVQVPCQRAASSAQVPCQGADPSYASSSKKAKPLSILKPRIRKINKDSIRFDKKVTVRDYHRTVGVAPTTTYALALDWTFAEGKATMESFGHGRTANGEACRVPTAYERRNILMEAGLDNDKLERLEDRARALCQGT